MQPPRSIRISRDDVDFQVGLPLPEAGNHAAENSLIPRVPKSVVSSDERFGRHF